ncbi:MAG: DUF1254 domain-containing protein [Acidobacteria bacterium]|nr:DUF1254 domain-containing protein [Acidobacteriota bacterium]
MKGVIMKTLARATIATLLGILAVAPFASAQDKPTPGFNNKIPKSILTPDKVKTSVGTLRFFDGIPTKKTAALLFENLDLNRGIDTFMNGMPAANMEAARRGHVALGQTKSNQIVIFDTLMDSNSLFLTGNTDTVYITTFLDLKRDGPIVIEIPAGSGPGIINDAYFRYMTNLGPPGPDKGKGGKYLVLPPGYKGNVPGGYFVAKSPSWVNWVLLRGFLKDGKPDFSSQLFRKGMKIYPLAQATNPPKMEFINGSKKVFNTVHSSDYKFFEELHAVVDREPIELFGPQVRGIFASIGIQKGKPFAPDARMKRILAQAAKLGNATTRALFWHERDKSAFLYKGSFWKRGYVGGSYKYLKDKGLGGRNIDARAQYFFMATFNSPALVWKLIGKGSKYAWGYLDQNGAYLDGAKNYKLNLPKDPPALKFMSVVVYDTQTRSQLQTGQRFPSKNNKRDKMIRNSDGSIDIYFGPKAPKGKKANWIQTVPGKGWFCLLRLYSPTKPWYDKTWRPGEIELVK